MTAVIRNAMPSDAEELAALVRGLGHEMSAGQVRANLERLDRDGLPQLVAELDGHVVGLAGLDRMEPVYRPRPVARLTILIVEENRRGRGIGRALVERALEVARGWGCGMVEVTSNDRLTDAHAYYRHLGFEQTSKRFSKSL